VWILFPVLEGPEGNSLIAPLKCNAGGKRSSGDYVTILHNQELGGLFLSPIFGGSKLTAVKMNGRWGSLGWKWMQYFYEKIFWWKVIVWTVTLNNQRKWILVIWITLVTFMLHDSKETFRIWRSEDQWNFRLAPMYSWSKSINMFSSSVCTSVLNFFSSIFQSIFILKFIFLQIKFCCWYRQSVIQALHCVTINCYCYESLFYKRYLVSFRKKILSV
jgi:hypothetical protein